MENYNFYDELHHWTRLQQREVDSLVCELYELYEDLIHEISKYDPHNPKVVAHNMYVAQQQTSCVGVLLRNLLGEHKRLCDINK